MKFMFVKVGGMLTPLDDETKEKFRRIGQGELVWVEHNKNRSLENHRRFFQFIKESFDMQDVFTDPEIWRKYVECMAGFFETQILPDGKTFYVPKSIAWDQLPDEHEFQQLFGKCVDAFIGWYEKRYGAMQQESQMRIMGFL